jgi:methyl coenzyme M reductase subunit D
MERVEKEDVRAGDVTLKIKNNPQYVKIENEDAIPAQFKLEVTEIRIDKNSIKDALKDGEEVDGAVLDRKTRLDIK